MIRSICPWFARAKSLTSLACLQEIPVSTSEPAKDFRSAILDLQLADLEVAGLCNVCFRVEDSHDNGALVS
jgi:hypothetical protein